MNRMSTTTKEQFDLAIKDLKEINDLLFYNDLKTEMDEHLNRLEAEYERVAQKAQEVHDYLDSYEYTFKAMTQEVETQLKVAIENTSDQLPALFNEQKASLYQAYELFLGLGEEQRAFIQTTNEEWKELSESLKNEQKAALDQVVGKLKTEVGTLLRETNEQVTGQRKQLEQEVKGQLQKFEQLMLQIQAQFDAILLTFQKNYENHKIRTETLIQKFVNETKEQFQLINQQINDLGKLMIESNEENKLHLDKSEHLFLGKWKEQETQLEDLRQSQETQSITMKKWIIGLAITNIAIIAGLAGLYLV